MIEYVKLQTKGCYNQKKGINVSKTGTLSNTCILTIKDIAKLEYKKNLIGHTYSE